MVTTPAHSPVTSSELFHDCVSLLLRHVTVHGGDGEIGLSHLLSQPFHLREEEEGGRREGDREGREEGERETERGGRKERGRGEER